MRRNLIGKHRSIFTDTTSGEGCLKQVILDWFSEHAFDIAYLSRPMRKESLSIYLLSAHAQSHKGVRDLASLVAQKTVTALARLRGCAAHLSLRRSPVLYDDSFFASRACTKWKTE